ncbi:MFS transporter [Bradyrhizobium canariense]|uniref:MFS transporter n=1 Tax=Bradyrhizobium canariense TaxID=255045 RepID=UPI00130299AE|nr:MFS transporter [Bradyrhizobium canariense]
MSARTNLREAVAGYRAASNSLHEASSRQSRWGLDWMNFFIADVQTGFGTYVAFYLARNGWSEGSTGLALTVGGLAGVLSQIPGGALCDVLTWKRGLVAIGIIAIGAAALILALSHSFAPILCAEVLHGVTAGIITPAIGAISLGLVGRRAMSLRTGRNYRFAAGGHAVTAVLMGLAGAYYWPGAMFLAAATLCVPALISLSFIRPNEIDYARARNAAINQQAKNVGRVLDLAKNRPLVLFAAAITLFQLADASTLPLIGENIARAGQGSVSISLLVIVPQIVVATISPWIGYHSEKRGRRQLLLIGFALEPVRAGLLASTTELPFLIIAQVLSGVTGAVIGVLMIVVIADLTVGSGRFNLAQGIIGAMSGLAASASTVSTGYFFQGFGSWTGFLVIAVIATAATALIWAFLSETKPPGPDEIVDETAHAVAERNI